MTVKFYTYGCPENTLHKEGYLSNERTFENVFYLDTTSEYEPILELGATNEDINELRKYTYCSINNNYYYVRDFQEKQSGIFDVWLELDPSMTYQNYIDISDAVVDRSEIGYNTYFRDQYDDCMNYLIPDQDRVEDDIKEDKIIAVIMGV